MKVNERMGESGCYETPAWNKENIPSYNNTQMRKKHLKSIGKLRPVTPLFEATFNPYPQHHNGFSIPIIPFKRPTSDNLAHLSDSNDIREGLARLALKQKPVIAKSSRLRDFFTQESGRYVEGEGQRGESKGRRRGRSLNALSVRRESLETLPDPIHKVASKPVRTRRQEFEQLYLKQRQAYERILMQHGVDETIDDWEFNKFMGCEWPRA